MKQLDADGRFTISNVVLIKWDLRKEDMQVFPNPATDAVTISGMLPDGIISLFNSQGEMLQQQNITANSITFQMSSYPAGVYLIRYTNGAVKKTFKVIKN